MAEYVAFARLDGGQVRPLLGRGLPMDDVGAGVTTDAVAASGSSPARPRAERVRELWEIVREEWSITTFFLFDPNSWRR